MEKLTALGGSGQTYPKLSQKQRIARRMLFLNYSSLTCLLITGGLIE
ncbi:hypothetical protein LY16_01068 [Xenorhabdus doucetiae]|uniref:Uncharacterized protein n=1 Tax=Xenorhabdus doucetiae TaxID=351671 RepID=A0ABY3NU21_9GAMM|nr:hypothetical protein LY16_01068 [Xenorhabdus doucetiae]